MRRVGNDEILSSPEDMSSSFSSPALLLEHTYFCAIQLLFTGTPQGSFKLQASNDFGESQRTTEAGRSDKVENWTDIEGSVQTISEAGNHMYCFQMTPFRWVRLVWTPTGGSGSLTSMRVNTKGN